MAQGFSRYQRQMLLPGVGETGQARVAASHAVVAGCGALGCAAGDMLARAGVGTLTIIDRDVVETTNLQRQCLFDERDAAAGLPKAEAARRRLSAVNSDVRVHAVVADLSSRNAERLVAPESSRPPPGVIVDGTDNFETRYLLNDLSVKLAIPYCYGGVVGTGGMQATFLPGRGPCLRCVFEDPPAPGTRPTCDTAGVLMPAVQIVAACQVSDAIQVLLGAPERIGRTLLEFDLWGGLRRRLDLPVPRAGCPCCGARDFAFLRGTFESQAVTLCGRDAVQIAPGAETALDLSAIAERLRPHGEFAATRWLVRGTLDAERSPEGRALELIVFADGRAIVAGTTRAELARTIYARYVGA